MNDVHLSPTRENTAAIDALALGVGTRVGLAGVTDDLTRRGRRAWAPGRAVDRAWTFDLRDRCDLRWWPQGITRGPGDLVLVSWYAKELPWDDGRKGSRITVLDLATGRYRHVLLVTPVLEDGVASYAPLRVHAGGIACTGSYLHVAATGKGFVTCRLDDILRLPDPSAAHGPSFGYRYLLPVRRTYRSRAAEGEERLRFSFLSLDRAASEVCLGEYTRDPERTRRLARFAVDADGLPVLGEDGSARPVAVGHGVEGMQGVALAEGRHHVTTSHGRLVLGSVWTGEPGHLRRHRWATPMGPEDLAYDPTTDNLWTVTEHPWARWVCAMPRSRFDP